MVNETLEQGQGCKNSRPAEQRPRPTKEQTSSTGFIVTFIARSMSVAVAMAMPIVVVGLVVAAMIGTRLVVIHIWTRCGIHRSIQINATWTVAGICIGMLAVPQHAFRVDASQVQLLGSADTFTNVRRGHRHATVPAPQLVRFARALL